MPKAFLARKRQHKIKKRRDGDTAEETEEILQGSQEKQMRQSAVDTGNHGNTDMKPPMVVLYDIEPDLSYKQFICIYCTKHFTTRYQLKRHLATHSGDRQHVCQICTAAFVLSSSLWHHMRTHRASRDHICVECGQAFGRSTALRMHRKTHSASKDHVCEVCGRAFHQKGNLKTHMNAHRGITPFQCKHCPKSYSQLSNLKRHLWKQHQEKQVFVCSTCDATFEKRRDLRDHERLSHQPVMLADMERRSVQKQTQPTNMEQMTPMNGLENISSDKQAPFTCVERSSHQQATTVVEEHSSSHGTVIPARSVGESQPITCTSVGPTDWHELLPNIGSLTTSVPKALASESHMDHVLNVHVKNIDTPEMQLRNIVHMSNISKPHTHISQVQNSEMSQLSNVKRIQTADPDMSKFPIVHTTQVPKLNTHALLMEDRDTLQDHHPTNSQKPQLIKQSKSSEIVNRTHSDRFTQATVLSTCCLLEPTKTLCSRDESLLASDVCASVISSKSCKPSSNYTTFEPNMLSASAGQVTSTCSHLQTQTHNSSFHRVLNCKTICQLMGAESEHKTIQLSVKTPSTCSIPSLTIVTSCPITPPHTPHSIATPSHSMTTSSHSLATPSHSITTPSHSITTPSHSITTPSHSITTPSHSMATSSHSITTPSHSITTPSHSMATPSHSIATSSHSMTTPSHSITTSSHSIATSSHSIATSSHSIATSYSIATSSHSIATSSHSIATSSHFMTTPSHSIATSSQSIATSSHSMATSSHSIATSSHSMTTPSHSIATSSHSITTPTHSIATISSCIPTSRGTLSHFITTPPHSIVTPSHSTTTPSHYITIPDYSIATPCHKRALPCHNMETTIQPIETPSHSIATDKNTTSSQYLSTTYTKSAPSSLETSTQSVKIHSSSIATCYQSTTMQPHTKLMTYVRTPFASIITSVDSIVTHSDYITTNAHSSATQYNSIGTSSPTTMPQTTCRSVLTHSHNIDMQSNSKGKASISMATQSNFIATPSNSIATSSNSLATSSNSLATQFNLIATQCNSTATPSNPIATQANSIASHVHLVSQVMSLRQTALPLFTGKKLRTCGIENDEPQVIHSPHTPSHITPIDNPPVSKQLMMPLFAPGSRSVAPSASIQSTGAVPLFTTVPRTCDDSCVKTLLKTAVPLYIHLNTCANQSAIKHPRNDEYNEGNVSSIKTVSTSKEVPGPTGIPVPMEMKIITPDDVLYAQQATPNLKEPPKGITRFTKAPHTDSSAHTRGIPTSKLLPSLVKQHDTGKTSQKQTPEPSAAVATNNHTSTMTNPDEPVTSHMQTYVSEVATHTVGTAAPSDINVILPNEPVSLRNCHEDLNDVSRDSAARANIDKIPSSHVIGSHSDVGRDCHVTGNHGNVQPESHETGDLDIKDVDALIRDLNSQVSRHMNDLPRHTSTVSTDTCRSVAMTSASQDLHIPRVSMQKRARNGAERNSCGTPRRSRFRCLSRSRDLQMTMYTPESYTPTEFIIRENNPQKHGAKNSNVQKPCINNIQDTCRISKTNVCGSQRNSQTQIHDLQRTKLHCSPKLSGINNHETATSTGKTHNTRSAHNRGNVDHSTSDHGDGHHVAPGQHTNPVGITKCTNHYSSWNITAPRVQNKNIDQYIASLLHTGNRQQVLPPSCLKPHTVGAILHEEVSKGRKVAPAIAQYTNQFKLLRVTSGPPS